MSKDQKENERLWQEYMSEKKEYRELVALLKSPGILDVFRDRVLEIILTYDVLSLPFVVNIGINKDSYRKNFLYLAGAKDIPDDKVKLAADILVKNIKAVKGQEGFLDEWIYYNRLIVGLLSRLRYEDGQDLFALFEINDIRPYWGMDESSGYTPLRALLWYENIDQRYVDEAVARMHRLIEDEMTGRSEPRVEHEDAFECYRYILTLMLMGSGCRSKNHRNMLAKEIIFMLGINNGKKILESHVLLNVWKLVPLSRENLYRLAERALNCGEDKFSIYSLETEEVAKLMMRDFPGLRSQIQTLVDEYHKNQLKQQQKAQTMVDKKKGLMDRMSGK